MNFASLLPKASFALLLLIFGCLVYIIARDHRLDQLSRARIQAEESERAAAALRAETNSSPHSPPEVREEYAPLRPRHAPPNVPPAPAEARPVLAQLPRDEGMAAKVNPQPVPVPIGAPAPDYSGFAGNGVPSASVSGGSVFTVTGQVFLRGTPPPEKQITLDPTCGRLHPKPITTRHYLTGEGGTLANVLVYVRTGAVSTGPPVAQSVLLDQIGCEYQPYVTAVQVDQPLIIRNSDPLLHNVHAIPQFAAERNFAQPTKGRTARMVFQRPEVFVRFKCDVHPWMFAYVAVVEHHWFAITGKDGRFKLPEGLSPGRYTLAAVHPKAGELTQDLVITRAAPESITFAFNAADTLATPSAASIQASLAK